MLNQTLSCNMSGIPQAFYGDRSAKVDEVDCVEEYPKT